MAHVHLFHDLGKIATFTPAIYQEDFKIIEEWRIHVHDTANWNPIDGIHQGADLAKTLYTKRDVRSQWTAMIAGGYNKIGSTQQMIDLLKERGEWNVSCTQKEIDKVMRYV